MSEEDFAQEVRTLIALAFGIVIVVAIALAVLLAGYALTGWRGFLWLNLVVAAMAILGFIYMGYRRSRLSLRY